MGLSGRLSILKQQFEYNVNNKLIKSSALFNYSSKKFLNVHIFD